VTVVVCCKQSGEIIGTIVAVSFVVLGFLIASLTVKFVFLYQVRSHSHPTIAGAFRSREI
jgi:hypothetical protein